MLAPVSGDKTRQSHIQVPIVFDASAKCKGISALNGLFHQGPKLQEDSNEVLLRLRRHHVALLCDTNETYLKVEADQDPDQDHHINAFVRVTWIRGRDLRNTNSTDRLR